MHRLHVDHYFCIGSTHQRAGEPCQDYALSGRLADGRVYGIVCDGCSGANARTDLGARVLALAIEQLLHSTATLADCFTPAFVQHIQERLLTMPLGGTAKDYLASAVAFCADAHTAKVFMAGDGALAVRRTDGTVEVTEASWPDNAPYYLGYCLQPAVLAQFALHEAIDGPTVQLRCQTGDTLDSTQAIPTQDFRLGWSTELALDTVDALMVCSDGIGQVSGLESLNAATTCLAFKNHAGGFVKRRAIKALQHWHSAGHIAQDDFSMAALARVTEVTT